MKLHSAFVHVSPDERRFIANSWEEGGFHTDSEGNPVRDFSGNTVRSFKVSSIGEDCADLLATAYAGDDAITNVSGFVMFLAYDCGLDNDTIIAVCDNLDLPLYTDALAQVRENLAIRSPELRLLDAIRNAE